MADEKNVPVRQVDILKKTLSSESIKEQFQKALGENSDVFVASVIDLYTGDEQLKLCNPNLIVAQALKAAVLKLPINKALGHAYIVSYNISVKKPDNTYEKVPTPVFMIGYKGYIQLAMRTGQYRIINADVVYEGEFRTKNKLTGEYDFNGEKTSNKIIGYFAYFELLNGFTKTVYTTVEEMAAHAKRYSAGIKFNKDVTVDSLITLANSGQIGTQVGWLGNFTDMALKTDLRNLISKWGYISIEMQRAFDSDREDETEVENAVPTSSIKKVDIQDVSFTDETGKTVPPVPSNEAPY